MDPISFCASLVTLIQLSTATIKYLRGVRDAPDDIKTLMIEVSQIKGLLSELQDLSETEETWLGTIQSLGTPGGPLEQYQSLLERVDDKLSAFVGLNRARMVLAWPFQKGEIKEILCTIERQKTIFSLALQNDHFGLSRAMKIDLVQVKRDVQETRDGVAELRKSQKDQESQNIITWLSPLNFSATQNDLLARRHDGTGEWLLDTKTFRKWLDGTERTLWCPGPPGAGKSVLASIIVDYVERYFEREDVAVTYAYCNYRQQESQTDTNLIASLLQQLVQRSPVVSDEVVSLYHRHIRKQTRPTLAEYSKLLQSEARGFSKTFIIVDALDECSEGNGTRDSLLDEIRKLQPNIHLLVTSRHISTIEREFQEAAKLEIRANGWDVKRYLEYRIGKENRLRSIVKADRGLQVAIVDTLAEKANGMFLVARLHMDFLAKKHSRRDIRVALQNLPEGLDGIYDEAMQRIEKQDEEDVKLAKQILSWISYALRPLTLRDLQHALALWPGDVSLDEEALPEEDLLVSVCGGLVTVDQESNIIRLLHYTTQEYFERIRTARFPDAHASIATTCLTYLSLDVFAEGYCPSDQEIEARLREYPLLEYAAQHWGDHARGGPEETIGELALAFLEHNSKLMCSIQVMHLQEHRYKHFSQHFPKDVTGLHIAASFGLEKIVRLLLLNGADIEARDSSGSTALHWAAHHGQEAVVQLLVEEGADIDAKDSTGRTALFNTAIRRKEGMVSLLVEKGADVDAKDSNGRTALHVAAVHRDSDLVRLLVEKGADVDAKDDSGRTALHRAADRGDDVVTRLLLKRGADIDAKDDESGLTALHLVVSRGDEAAARVLLEEGANVDATDYSGRTALHRAADKGYEMLTRLLVEKGANVHSKDESRGWTALHWAAWNVHEAVARLLLGKGSNVVTVLRLLLEKGVDINRKDGEHGQTALHRAAIEGHEAVVRLLLEKGADIDMADDAGRTALHEAVSAGHSVVTMLLLENGANIEAKDNFEHTALHRATYCKDEGVTRLLLEKGADPHAKDRWGWTALQSANSLGHKAVAKLLTTFTRDF